MDVVAYLPADPQAAEPVQMGERTLHAPALDAQAGTVLGAAAEGSGAGPGGVPWLVDDARGCEGDGFDSGASLAPGTVLDEDGAGA